ncbi:MAG: TonB-dependent receptor plug domain-containing protein [Hyphomonadaceae bacterium]|nr:TonB-dependent receptor plug domain-containing protein [Hyphomonadaceae bacterium]
MNRLPSTRHRRHASLIAIGWGLVCALPAGAVQAQTAVAAEGATEVIAATRADPIVVVGDRVQRAARPGSSYVITEEDLTNARIFTVNEALRQVPGVNVRDEEGLGLRPNIGVRGLSPTRSREVILLEDGLPLSYGLYGDNASYSHPPVRRFARIEVLKGAGQVRFGPHTVGAVFNFITPPAPDTFSGRATVAAGSRGYGEVDLSLGGPVAGFRVLAHGNATQFDGIRDNHGFAFHDLYAKVEREIGANHLIIARTGLYEEDSQVSYSGLTEAEYAANPRGNAFENDSFITKRATASLRCGLIAIGGVSRPIPASALRMERVAGWSISIRPAATKADCANTIPTASRPVPAGPARPWAPTSASTPACAIRMSVRRASRSMATRRLPAHPASGPDAAPWKTTGVM